MGGGGVCEVVVMMVVAATRAVCRARLRRTCFASTVLYSVSNIHDMRPCAHTLLSESTTLLQVGVCLATGKG